MMRRLAPQTVLSAPRMQTRGRSGRVVAAPPEQHQRRIWHGCDTDRRRDRARLLDKVGGSPEPAALDMDPGEIVQPERQRAECTSVSGELYLSRSELEPGVV